MCVMEEEQKERCDEDTCDEEGISKSMEEAGRRVKAGQVKIKEHDGWTNQWKMEGQFLRLVMTSTDELQDISVAS